MKSLFVLVAIVLAVPVSFAAFNNDTQLVMEVVSKSGLESKMAKDQANDLVSLRKALYKAIKVDADAKGFLEESNAVILPEIAKIQNNNIQAYEYLVLQYNLILIAAENGYEEQNH